MAQEGAGMRLLCRAGLGTAHVACCIAMKVLGMKKAVALQHRRDKEAKPFL